MMTTRKVLFAPPGMMADAFQHYSFTEERIGS